MLSLIPLKDWLYIGAIVALLAGFGLFVHHERAIGRAQIEQQDIASKAVLDSQVKTDEQISQLAADRAAEDRQGVKKQLDDYMAAHPTGPVRLCAQNHSDAGLPQTARAGESAVSPSTGPFASGEVPAGSQTEGPDIGPELDTIVRSFGELAGLYRARQQLKE